MYYILLGPNKSYKILLRTTKYCCVLQTTTRYLSVLQSTISYYPVLQNTTKTHALHTQTQAHRAIRQIDAKRPWHGWSPLRLDQREGKGIQEISNGRTYVSRTPKKNPEYLCNICLASCCLGVRWGKVPCNF